MRARVPASLFGSALPALILTGIFALPGCTSSQGEKLVLDGGRRVPDSRTPDLAPFIDLARQSACTDQRNRLYQIDESLVFWDRAGSCADASYGWTLYGRTPDDVLCWQEDSIAGPRSGCNDPSYHDMFQTIVSHLDDPDLGLGPGHTVVRIPF